MENNIRIIKGSYAFLEELQANLFNMISENGHELNGNEVDGYALKIDMSQFNEDQQRLIEVALKARIQSGIWETQPEEINFKINEELCANSFAITVVSAEKLEIVQKDILRGAKVPEENIIMLNMPFALGMYNTLVAVVIAFNLNENQMQAIELASKTARTGIKIQKFTRKAGLVAVSTANVANRVIKDVALAGTEVGATVLAGSVKTVVEASACALNIGIRDLNPKELVRGENVMALRKTIRTLFKKDDSKISNGFASL